MSDDETPRDTPTETVPDPATETAPAPRRRVIGRKLLVAAVGVATISYVACTRQTTSGNLVAPPPEDVQDVQKTRDVQPGPDVFSGNLIPPPPDDVQDVQTPVDRMVMSGNLVPPPPDDGGMDGGR